MMSACIIAAQLVMLPIALLVGRAADTWGRKPLFLAGFAILPIRAVLYTLSDNSFWLIGVQALDGVGAGIFGALTPLVIADIMRGTGRYNLAQGAIATVLGIGALTERVSCGRDRRSRPVQRRSPIASPARLMALWTRPTAAACRALRVEAALAGLSSCARHRAGPDRDDPAAGPDRRGHGQHRRGDGASGLRERRRGLGPLSISRLLEAESTLGGFVPPQPLLPNSRIDHDRTQPRLWFPALSV
jgi:hypothetical protein